MWVISQNFVAIGQSVPDIWPFFDIFKMAIVRHLGFVMSMFVQPTKTIWWSLSLYKISLESIGYTEGSITSLQVLIFNQFGLKMPRPIHAPKWRFCGFIPRTGEQPYPNPQMALPCVESRHMMRPIVTTTSWKMIITITTVVAVALAVIFVRRIKWQPACSWKGGTSNIFL